MSTLKIKRENGKIFCPLADSWHIETPEEKVRQEYIKIVERVEIVNNLIITVVRIYPKDRSVSFHVTSFIQTKNNKITTMDEYYADDGIAPQWRLDKHIGTSIK